MIRLKKQITTVALAGNPNSGKTTMFNLLTGARQKIGNYPGVTVEIREGMKDYKDTTVNFVDLPGIYSLSAFSPEELVAQKYLLYDNPHLVVVVVDSTSLERSLYFIIQLLELHKKVIVALNMLDEASNSGIIIDIEKLQKALNIPIIPTIAKIGKGRDELLDCILSERDKPETQAFQIDYGRELEHAIAKMINIIQPAAFLDYYPNNRAIATRYLETDSEIISEGIRTNAEIHKLLISEVTEASGIVNKLHYETPEAIIADKRYEYIASILSGHIVYDQHAKKAQNNTLEVVDRILTSPFLGSIFLCLVLYAIFWLSTSLSSAPMRCIQSVFDWLETLVNMVIPPGQLNSLITSGILSGTGSVLSFVPIIGLMFTAISILENSGYMARISYMLDRVFRVFGLHGNSVVALIVSGGIGTGCAVPGVMATRILRSQKEKIATIVTAPIMSCGAKLPVFTLLSAVFFPDHITEVLFLITLLSWIFVFAIARFLRSTVITGPSTPFLMELPPYRLPTLKSIIIHVWERVWQYLRKAGTVVIAVSILLWASMSYPLLPKNKIQEFAAARTATQNSDTIADTEKQIIITHINNKESEMKLHNSYAGKVGRAIEPISKLAGFDWKINISLLGGVIAKEVIISTLATAFSMGATASEDSDDFAMKLKNSKSLSKATAISLILFTMLYAPCFVTVIIIGKEAGIKWALFSIIFNTLTAFTVAAVFFQLATHYFNI